MSHSWSMTRMWGRSRASHLRWIKPKLSRFVPNCRMTARLSGEAAPLWNSAATEAMSAETAVGIIGDLNTMDCGRSKRAPGQGGDARGKSQELQYLLSF